jgi:CheY-like chemotaxis protein
LREEVSSVIEDQLERDIVSWPFTALRHEHAREFYTPAAPDLLIACSNATLTTHLQMLLPEEGYTFHVAATLVEALALLEQHSFQCMLTDRFSGPYDSLFGPIQLFRRRGWTIPVGMIASEEFSAEEAEEDGFAFVLSTPLQAERLFTELALGLGLGLTPAQERQAQVVKDFFAALNAKNTQKILHLCTRDVSYYPAASHHWLPLFRAISSQSRGEGYTEFIHQPLLALRLEIERISSRPRGLAVQYNAWWAEPNQGWEVQTDTLLFHFLDDRIHQIGLPRSGKGSLPG